MVIKQRSPNYPGIDLVESVELIKKLYPKVQRGEFTPSDAAGPMGYSSVSGPVRRKIGALKQYGLIEQKRGDNAKLSTRALTLLLRNAASNEYRAALKEAALDPPLFKELYEAGKHTAADDALKQFLIVERGFTDDGATSFIDVLRATLALANLTDAAIIAGQEEVKEDEEEDMQSLAQEERNARRHDPPHLSEDHTRVPLRLLGGQAIVAIELPSSMSEKAWKQMMAMLKALKPGYVEDAEDSSEDEANEEP